MVMITAKIRALLPKVVTRRDIIRGVPSRWAEAYTDDNLQLAKSRAGDVRLALERLDICTATVADVAAIIGNELWTELTCNVCEQDRDTVVSVPREYEGPINVCLDCADGVAEMLRERIAND